jgi:hypothetical protein
MPHPYLSGNGTEQQQPLLALELLNSGVVLPQSSRREGRCRQYSTWSKEQGPAASNALQASEQNLRLIIFSVHIISNLARLHLPLGDRYQPERYVTRRYKGILHMGATRFTFLLGDPWPSVGPGKSTLGCRDATDLGAAGWRNMVCAFLTVYLEARSVDVESWPGPPSINREYRGSYSISHCQAFPNLKTFRDDNISTILDQVR